MRYSLQNILSSKSVDGDADTQSASATGDELSKNFMIMSEKNIAVVETQMLIRKPVSEVFNAFIDPQVTTNFWFTKSSGPLKVGETITWEWEMYGISTKVLVKDIVQDKKISIEWGNPATTVDFEFTVLKDGSTYVVIKNYGFKEKGDELIEVIKNNTGGFTTVLDGLKGYLEHGMNLNLIADKFPKEVSDHGK